MGGHLKNEGVNAAREHKPASVLPTAIGLVVLFVGTSGLAHSLDSDYFVGGAAVISALVAVGGLVLFGIGGLWAALTKRGPLARSRLLRAAAYLSFGIASFATGHRPAAVEGFRTGLQPGMSVQEALRRLDTLYTEHPERWRFITGWGTARELALEDYRTIGQSEEGTVLFTWSRGQPRDAAAVAATAEALSKTRQVWFTFRTDVGFLHFFVTLDDRGLIKSVSKATGHQA